MAENKRQAIVERNEALIRIAGYDISGDKNISAGLTKIKGVSWMISNILCKKLAIDKKERVKDLSKEKVKEIEEALKDLDIYDFLKNRNSDRETGESKHVIGVNLDMKKEFDIKRLKKIKSYKGTRHSLRLPVRGQRTRSHFRKSGIAVGVKKPKQGKKS